MYSVFDNVSTRLFCIFGELSDIFCTQGGWLLTFEELLTYRLEALGFESVIFFSTQRGLFYAVDVNGAASFDILSGKNTEKKQEPQKKSYSGFAGLGINTSGRESETEERKKETPVRFIHEAELSQLDTVVNRYMLDTKSKKALVFTSMEDLIKLNSSEEGRRILEAVEEWKGLPNDNKNICIFLSRTLDSEGTQNLLHENRVAVLESLFIKNSEFNRNSCISIGPPMNDEVSSLLEYLRIRGYTYTEKSGAKRTVKLKFRRADKEKLVRLLSFCNRDSGFTQLKEMKELLERFMLENGGSEVWLTPDDVYRCYPRAEKNDRADSDPMELLRSRKGWESAYRVLKSYISTYRAMCSGGVPETRPGENAKTTVDRFEPDEQLNKARGKAPNFVLQGPPGVGKTEIANLIGRILQREGVLKSGHTVEGSRDKMIGQYVGSTAIKTASLIEQAQEGVLLVDEVYSMAEKRGSETASFCGEAFDTIVAAMTNSSYHFCVIFSGYADRMPQVWRMNEGLYSRFGASNIITLEEYGPELLREIFESGFGKPEGINGQVTALSDEVREGLPVFFENYFADRDRKDFGNARDINNLAAEVKRRANYRCLSEAEEAPGEAIRRSVTVIKEDFGERQSLFEKRGLTAADIFKSLREYEGFEFLEEMFNDQLALLVECREKNIPYPGPSHMIWAGSPGTGKSTAAQLTAEFYHSLGILGGTEPVYADASEIVSSYVSGSASNMREKMDEACKKNTVLIIEEAYQLLEKGGKDAIHAMLNRMETDKAKFNLILILYKDKVEEFLSENPGLSSRLNVYYFNDYNERQLFSIFLRMCEKSRDEASDGCREAVKEYIRVLYAQGYFEKGNARCIRQLLDEMKKNRYRRILKRIADERFGGDLSAAAAARAMGGEFTPAPDCYVFLPEDVPPADTAGR